MWYIQCLLESINPSNRKNELGWDNSQIWVFSSFLGECSSEGEKWISDPLQNICSVYIKIWLICSNCEHPQPTTVLRFLRTRNRFWKCICTSANICSLPPSIDIVITQLLTVFWFGSSNTSELHCHFPSVSFSKTKVNQMKMKIHIVYHQHREEGEIHWRFSHAHLVEENSADSNLQPHSQAITSQTRRLTKLKNQTKIH